MNVKPPRKVAPHHDLVTFATQHRGYRTPHVKTRLKMMDPLAKPVPAHEHAWLKRQIVQELARSGKWHRMPELLDLMHEARVASGRAAGFGWEVHHPPMAQKTVRTVRTVGLSSV